MKKFAIILSCAAVVLAAFAGLNDDTQTLDHPLPDAQTALYGKTHGNSIAVTNMNDILVKVATNLVSHKVQISLNNCIWDPTTKILYERTIKDNKLFYIAVTNVDLISKGLPLVREQ